MLRRKEFRTQVWASLRQSPLSLFIYSHLHHFSGFRSYYLQSFAKGSKSDLRVFPGGFLLGWHVVRSQGSESSVTLQPTKAAAWLEHLKHPGEA